MKQGIIITLIFLTILALWWFSGYWIYSSFGETQRGSIGDMFGAINALFSGLALTGIIITIYLQQKELSLQRKELQQTRDVFQKQKFEHTFFNLASLHHDILKGIKYEFTITKTTNNVIKSQKKHEYVGKEFFDFAEREYKNIYGVLANFGRDRKYTGSANDELSKTMKIYKLNKLFLEKISPDISEIQLVLAADKVLFSQFQVKYAHFFRHLYRILKFVKSSQDEELSKLGKLDTDGNRLRAKEVMRRYKNYVGFIQAQMSTSELFILFYNSLKFPNMMSVMDEYCFLENLPVERLINQSHTTFYRSNLNSNADIYKLYD